MRDGMQMRINSPCESGPMRAAAAAARWRTVVAVSCFLLGPSCGALADIGDTAFYQTARAIHLADVEYFRKVTKSNDATVSNILQALSISKNDSFENDSVGRFIAELLDQCRGLSLPRMAIHTRHEVDADECRERLERLLYVAAQKQDMFSSGLVHWMRNVMESWQNTRWREPEEVAFHFESVPRPYVYEVRLTVPRLTNFYSDSVNEYKTSVTSRDSTYNPLPPAEKDLSYTTSTTTGSQLDSSSLAVALTDFLISRASQELLYGLLNDALKDDQEQELEKLLPATIAFLDGSGFTQLATFVPTLRTALADDIRDLPVSLLSIDDGDSDVHRVYEVLELIRNGLLPSVALSRLPSHESARTCCNVLDLVGVVAREWSNSALSGSGRVRTIGGFDRFAIQQYVDPDRGGRPFIRNLLDDDVLRCWGATHDDDAPPFPNFPWGCHIFWPLVDGYRDEPLARTLEGLSLRMDQLDTLVYGRSVSLVEQRSPAESGSSEPSEEKSSEKPGESLETDVSRSRPVPVTDVLKMTVDAIETAYAETGGAPHEDPLILWMQAYLAAVEHRYTDAASMVLRYLYATRWDRDPTRVAPRLLVLGANLVEAKTTDEFQAALYAAADPVGSYVTKRQSGQHLTIGAYLGLAGGFEFKPQESEDEWALHLGTALPIGIEWSFGLSESEKEGSSVGIFLSPIDLGVVANYRFQDAFNSSRETTVEAPQIGLRQLLAPSAYVVFSMDTDLPLALALGIQYAPGARAEDGTVPAPADRADANGESQRRSESDMNGVDAFRLSFIVAIDVTLLRL